MILDAYDSPSHRLSHALPLVTRFEVPLVLKVFSDQHFPQGLTVASSDGLNGKTLLLTPENTAVIPTPLVAVALSPSAFSSPDSVAIVAAMAAPDRMIAPVAIVAAMAAPDRMIARSIPLAAGDHHVRPAVHCRSRSPTPHPVPARPPRCLVQYSMCVEGWRTTSCSRAVM